jgi:hypothetical protein
MDAEAPLSKNAQRQRRKQEEKAFANREPPEHEEQQRRSTKKDPDSEVSVTSSAVRGEQELIGK